MHVLNNLSVIYHFKIGVSFPKLVLILQNGFTKKHNKLSCLFLKHRKITVLNTVISPFKRYLN